ncbi:MAG TPA: ABC transporter permease [Chloroflexota bacterium]|nr:ABC transporter permease [Chloroflexota bacterium]
MRELLAAEFVKMRFRWMPRIIVLIMLAIIGLIFWGVGTGDQRANLFFPRGLLAGLVFSGFFAPFLWPVLAGAWAGNEYSWGTLRLVLTRRPSRIQYAVSSLIILAVTAIVALVLALILSAILGALIGSLTGHGGIVTGGLPSDFVVILIKTFVAIVYVVCYYLILAFTAATIFQSPAAGIGIGIGVWIAEQVVTGIFTGLGSPWTDISDRFPIRYSSSLVERVVGNALSGRFVHGAPTAGLGEAIIGLAIYMAIFLALTLFVLRERDVTA